jgi:hypothetical protein
MKFLKIKFGDSQEYINHFVTINNSLLCLEKNDMVNDEIKANFVSQFIDKLIQKEIINSEIINAIDDLNAWSIDFPSWYGNFDEQIGKKILIIGSEPHIHNKYLQTVYGFNSEKSIDDYLYNSHPIFKFVSELVSYKLKISKEDALKECYLTDLFPLSPFRGNGKSVGSTDKIQKVIGNKGSWVSLRHNYAKQNLSYEIENVKPELIITQGKEVFEEVIKILNIHEKINFISITPSSGKRQFIRSVKWNSLTIISVPHIGSQRMRTFWNNNIDAVKNAMLEI